MSTIEQLISGMDTPYEAYLMGSRFPKMATSSFNPQSAHISLRLYHDALEDIADQLKWIPDEQLTQAEVNIKNILKRLDFVDN